MSAPQRLSRHDFNHLKVERRVGGTYLTLAIGSVHGRQVRGFACVVSKKAARKAVDRNRIKRRIRAIFQKIIPSLPHPTVVVVYAKSGASNAQIDDLRKDIYPLLTRLGVIPTGGES